MSLDPVNDELLPQRPARPARAPPEPGERASGPAADRRLRRLNPRVRVEPIPENVTEWNVDYLVSEVDLVIDAAPVFKERFLVNAACVRLNKPLVECAIYDMEGQVTSIVPGKTPCLSCLYPVEPPAWKREFPVLGATAGMAGCLGAVEAIKLLTGI